MYVCMYIRGKARYDMDYLEWINLAVQEATFIINFTTLHI